MDDDELRRSGIDLSQEDGRCVVRMWGDVDAGLRGQASAVMVSLLQRRLPVVIDVSGVRFLDSSGVAFIIQLHRLGQDDATGLVLRDPPDHVMELLHLIGLVDQVAVERVASRPRDASPRLPVQRTAAAGGAASVADGDDGLALTPGG